MSGAMKHPLDKNSAEFNEGVEPGRSSTGDTKNWQAGKEMGQELKEEGEKREPVYGNTFRKTTTPLFMRVGSAGNSANDQDEKDEAEE